MDSIIIKSANSSNFLKFDNKDGEYFNVTISSTDHSGSVRVFGFEDTKYLVSLFNWLSQQWKGFDGLKTWTSIEGEFKIKISSDDLGHFIITVILSNHNIESDEYWTLESDILVESGMLLKISQNINQFFLQ